MISAQSRLIFFKTRLFLNIVTFSIIPEIGTLFSKDFFWRTTETMNSLRSNVRVNDFSLWGGNCCSNYCRSARKVCSEECVQLGMHYRKDDGVRWGDIAAEYRLWWGWYITCHLVPCRVGTHFLSPYETECVRFNAEKIRTKISEVLFSVVMKEQFQF